MDFNLSPQKGINTAPIKVVQSILIVDSNYIFAEKLDKILRGTSHLSLGWVDKLPDIEAAIEADKPDLIIININTEGQFDGYQIAKILKLDYDISLCIIYDEESNDLKKWTEEIKPDCFIPYTSDEKKLKKQLSKILN